VCADFSGSIPPRRTNPSRRQIKRFARDSVRIINATLRALLNAALDEGVIVANPADKLGRRLRLVVNAKTRQEEVKAMTRDQLAAFLTVSRTRSTAYERRHYPLFLLRARTGMRLGESLGLQRDDVHFAENEMQVARTLSGGRIDRPKSGHGRPARAHAAEALHPAQDGGRHAARREPRPEGHVQGVEGGGALAALLAALPAPHGRACSCSRASRPRTSSGSSATPRFSSPWTRTGSGGRWGTRPP
jgi:hypothetical protein